MDDLGRALWLALPVILGGLTHVAVIRAGLGGDRWMTSAARCGSRCRSSWAG